LAESFAKSSGISMRKTNIQAIYPLSPLQRGILFHSIYQRESTKTYVVQLNCDLHGSVDVPAFHSAWQKILGRHASLRTLFTWENRNEPLQIVCTEVELPWSSADWRHLDAREQQEQLRSFLQSDIEKGFELSSAPLMRIALIRLASDVYKFVWTKHHLIMDGWSSMKLMQEILACYEAARHGQEAALPQPRPYRDYIAWLKQQDLKLAETFWRRTLKGFHSPTPLPIPARASTEGITTSSDREIVSALSPSLTMKLEAAAREYGITLNTIVLGAWALLLSRHTGEDDVVLGATVSGRPAEIEDVEAMVGLFINTLPVRVRTSGELPLRTWLLDLQAQLAEARQYEYSSLVDIQAWSDVPRGSSLFRTYVVFENYPSGASSKARAKDGGAIEIRDLEIKECPNYPLLLVAVPGKQLQLRVVYSSSSYDALTATRILGHLQNLFETMLANPERRLPELSCLNEAERHQVLVEWNDSRKDFGNQVGLSDKIALEMSHRPDAVALLSEDTHLSYRELELRSSRLANYLRKFGVRSEVRVAVCLERSVEMVIAILSILKAGGAYVPLDPEYPAERLAHILEDSGSAVVLTEDHLREHLPRSSAFELSLDAESEEIARENPLAPIRWADPQNLAYILYTSGSTGRPKGVAISEGSLANHMSWMIEEFALSEADRVLQKTPFSFDASVWEFWAPLLCGGQLVIARPGGHADGEYLGKTVCESQITILQLVPTQLRLMLAAGSGESVKSLRQLFSGGEALSEELREQASRYFRCPLCNLYGPTEATIDTIFWRCEPSDNASAPIGRPISNTASYLLDDLLEPVAPAAEAQLYLAGPGLARGYWRNPELTADRFLPDPFSRCGERMYRTGDIVKQIADGKIMYLGRSDHQVKIRGARIELGEIERLLLEHPLVSQAVVVAREDTPEIKRLVAYVVATEESATGPNELLNYLASRLPQAMHPAACVMLAALPLTASGKIDRNALPKPELGIQRSRYLAPRNVLEDTLCRIWSEVLRIERVSADANFFELGGDSILCIQIVSRVRQAGYAMAPVDLFENQTIESLATVLASGSCPVSQTPGQQQDIPFTPIQQRFFDEQPANPHHANQSVLLSLKTPLASMALEFAIDELLQRHDSLRFRFAYESGRWRQFRSDAVSSLRVPTVDLSQLSPFEQTEAAEMVARELHQNLNISQGPLFRLALFQFGDHREKLLIVIHHLVVDGVSWRILLEDLQVAYEQIVEGEPASFAAGTSSFAAWAELLRTYGQSDGLKEEASYWITQQWVAEPPGMPVDTLCGENTVESARTVSRCLSAEETAALLRELPALYQVRINDLLLGALVHAYFLWTGQRTLLVDMEAHGREALFRDVDLSRTVGWFTAVFPVWLELRSEQTHELLRNIREQSGAIARGGLPFGVLRYLNADTIDGRKLRQLPNPQLSFNYLGQFDQIFAENSRFESGEENFGPVLDGNDHRRYVLNFNALVLHGQLRVDWTYSENIHRHHSIAKLADLYLSSIRHLMDQSDMPQVSRYAT
jgi:amino acid adenylation domain-containing protein/non-ribosomal peptide synthase protein (TIGR01720 family)